MNTLQQTRERIELADHDYLFCSSCGEPMNLVVRNGELWTECRTLSRAGTGLRGRLLAAFHDRHWVATVGPEPLVDGAPAGQALAPEALAA